MDHQELTGSPIRLIVDVRKSGIDGEVVARIWIHQTGGNRIKALRSLPVPLLKLRPSVAGPPADRIGSQQREESGFVDFPYFELRFFLEDPDKDRRPLRHIAALEIGNQALGEWPHVAPVYRTGTLRVATAQRYCGRNRTQ